MSMEICFKHEMKNGLFPLEHVVKWENSNLVEFDSAFKDISIFNIDKRGKKPTNNYEIDATVNERERPVTPINDSIQLAPDSFDVLSKQIRRRLQPRPNWRHLREQEQTNMAAIILTEAHCRWGTFLSLADDPFLSKRLNNELRRRISVQIVLVCEKLFLFHASNIKTLNKRGVYSVSTNITRTYTQLTLDMDKYLNVLAIRRRMLVDLRNELNIGYKPGVVNNDVNILRKIDPVVAIAPSAPRSLSFGSLIKTNDTGKKKNGKYNMDREIRDIERSIKPFNMEKNPVFQLLPTRPPSPARVQNDGSCDDSDISYSGSNYSTSSEAAARDRELLMKIVLRKSPSEPDLPTIKLLDELTQKKPLKKSAQMKADVMASLRTEEDEMMDVVRLHTCKSIDSSLHLVDWDEKLGLREKKDSLESTGEGRPADGEERVRGELGDDLKKITRKLGRNKICVDVDCEEDEETSIPPLITSITRLQRQDKKLKLMKKLNVEMDRHRIEVTNAERDAIPLPICPQPPVIQMRMPVHKIEPTSDGILVRIADVVMPNNIQFPKHRLNLQEPLYNNLTGEISSELVRDLDKNLCDDKELQEVFNEIMDTVDDNHLLHDNDHNVMEAAQNVDLNHIMASATLSLSPSQQIINQDLASSSRQRQPLKCIVGGDSDDKSHGIGTDEASWLAWWKSTITSDDYLKYISTQETDYLNVIFHFYDSEFGSVTASVESSIDDEQMKCEQKKKMMSKVIEEKAAWKQDMWNCQAVMLGGLGHFPDTVDSDDELTSPRSLKPPQVDASRSKSEQIDADTRADDTEGMMSSDGSFQSGEESGAEEECEEEDLHLNDDAIGTIAPPPTRDETTERPGQQDDNPKRHTSQRKTTTKQQTSQRKTTKKHRKIKYKKEGQDEVQENTYTREADIVSHQVIESKAIRYKVSEIQFKVVQRQQSTEEDKFEVSPRNKVQRSEEVAFDEELEQREAELEERLMNMKWMRHLYSDRRGTLPQGATESSPQPKRSTDRRKRNMTRILETYFGNYCGKKRDEDAVAKRRNVEREQDAELQGRLSAVWKRLQMSDDEVMDIIARFTSDPHDHGIRREVEAWENAAKAVYEREIVLAELEAFERFASDPNRFFSKGTKNSVMRMEEAKRRSYIYSKLYKMDKRCRHMLTLMKKKFGFEVKYGGRNYSEKMERDKTEMLYWLQQERRCVIMGNEGMEYYHTLTNNRNPSPLQRHRSNKPSSIRNLPKVDLM